MSAKNGPTKSDTGSFARSEIYWSNGVSRRCDFVRLRAEGQNLATANRVVTLSLHSGEIGSPSAPCCVQTVLSEAGAVSSSSA